MIKSGYLIKVKKDVDCQVQKISASDIFITRQILSTATHFNLSNKLFLVVNVVNQVYYDGSYSIQVLGTDMSTYFFSVDMDIQFSTVFEIVSTDIEANVLKYELLSGQKVQIYDIDTEYITRNKERQLKRAELAVQRGKVPLYYVGDIVKYKRNYYTVGQIKMRNNILDLILLSDDKILTVALDKSKIKLEKRVKEKSLIFNTRFVYFKNFTPT